MNRDFVREKPFLVSLCALPGMRYRLLVEMITLFGSPEGAWDAVSAGLALKLAGDGKNEEWKSASLGVDPRTAFSRIMSQGIGVKVFGETGYPVLLGEINDPPPVIYYKGEMAPDLGQGVAIVGSRKATSYGRELAWSFARDFSGRGVPVISGAAYGIDSEAHKGAVINGGRTAAVLGCGIDIVYPRTSAKLFREIEESGCLISEYPPGTPPKKQNFPVRNRIIAGMSLGVVVVEAAARSGALITADLALSYGREVFAVPGSVYSQNSSGTNNLIKSGASLITCAGDACEELGIGDSGTMNQKGATATSEDDAGFDDIESGLIEKIREGVSDIDELVGEAGCPPGVAISKLSLLQV
ncbi:MAG: DNA-processing protein DprA, partial [Actinobacteria bacterium]|nr:DNA-processing protein DprA [Actinomycetota bacterium]